MKATNKNKEEAIYSYITRLRDFEEKHAAYRASQRQQQETDEQTNRFYATAQELGYELTSADIAAENNRKSDAAFAVKCTRQEASFAAVALFRAFGKLRYTHKVEVSLTKTIKDDAREVVRAQMQYLYENGYIQRKGQKA